MGNKRDILRGGRQMEVLGGINVVGLRKLQMGTRHHNVTLVWSRLCKAVWRLKRADVTCQMGAHLYNGTLEWSNL